MSGAGPAPPPPRGGGACSTSGRRVFDAFPYEPYQIQQDFMEGLFECLEAGGVGVFESPTGTGKTLSMICSTLAWLEEAKRRKVAGDDAPPPAAASDDDEPDWMQNAGHEQEKQRRAEREADKAKRLEKARSAAAAHLGSLGGGGKTFGSKPAPKSSHVLPGLEDEDAFLLDEERGGGSSGEEAGGKRKPGPLLPLSDSDEEEGAGEEEEEDPDRLQVIFCSRTHSQLAQFVGELQRTRFSGSIQCATLGSRKNLCINELVARLKSQARINERCMELQGSGGKKLAGDLGKPEGVQGCPHLKAGAVAKLRDMVLAQPMDLEDLASLGRAHGACPYYGSRKASRRADLVLLPYQSLVHKGTRDALGIRLPGNVVIVDEAHNLEDSIGNVHSAVVSGAQLAAAQSQLQAYFGKFKARLGAANRQNIQLMLQLVKSLLKVVGVERRRPEVSAPGAAMHTVNDFVFSTGIDNVNLFSIVRWVYDSKALFKISSYGDFEKLLAANEVGEVARVKGAPGEASVEVERMSSLHALIGLLEALTNTDEDGRILVTQAPRPEATQIKFLLLNAARHFEKVVSEARAVVLAGGTLQPPAELAERLFPGVPAGRLRHFACGHVVEPERLLTIAIEKGPSGVPLQFSHKSRSDPAVIDELGRLLLNMCQVVPEGVVVFFPSYSYEQQVHDRWQKEGLVSKLEARKKLFREPRGVAGGDLVLQQYSHAATGGGEVTAAAGGGGGAILLSVVGGKMSEGINFSDGMGRLVLMVGLPYPDPTDPELKEKMRYLDTSVKQGRGREYYEGLCMKAVNQSIGRAIRHRGDYATIVLADSRWSSPTGPAAKLPAWIGGGLQVASAFGQAQGCVAKFFRQWRTSGK